MNRTGWTKNWRKKWDNPILRGNPYRLAVWDWIISHAEWREDVSKRDQHVIEGVRRPLELGEVSCGRDQIAKDTGVSSSGVQKILDRYVSEHMLEQQTYSRFRLLKVTNWNEYQSSEQMPEHIRDNKVTTEEQQRDTTYKEYKNLRSKEPRRVSHVFVQHARLLAGFLRNENPAFRQKFPTDDEPTILRWASDIEKLSRLDHMEPEQIEVVIRWIFEGNSKNAMFWRRNIMSGKKLRDQFITLVGQMKSDVQSRPKIVRI